MCYLVHSSYAIHRLPAHVLHRYWIIFCSNFNFNFHISNFMVFQLHFLSFIDIFNYLNYLNDLNYFLFKTSIKFIRHMLKFVGIFHYLLIIFTQFLLTIINLLIFFSTPKLKSLLIFNGLISIDALHYFVMTILI
jgi:hypothetical protein